MVIINQGSSSKDHSSINPYTYVIDDREAQRPLRIPEAISLENGSKKEKEIQRDIKMP